MITRRVQAVKDSLLITLPRQLCHLMEIKKGAVFKFEYEGNKIILTPVPLARQDNNGTEAETTHPGVCANE